MQRDKEKFKTELFLTRRADDVLGRMEKASGAAVDLGQ
jgi:hypothetical protein